MNVYSNVFFLFLWFCAKQKQRLKVLTMSNFSIRANREGISEVYRVPSSVVQAAKAGMKTWWTALTTRSDGSPSDSSISSKPCRTYRNRRTKKKLTPQPVKHHVSHSTAGAIRNKGFITAHIPGSICQGRLCIP